MTTSAPRTAGRTPRRTDRPAAAQDHLLVAVGGAVRRREARVWPSGPAGRAAAPPGGDGRRRPYGGPPAVADPGTLGSMRASRLVSLLLLLQARGRMTAQELANELEVSPRTIYRDVESLSSAGVPVYADRGPTGGYQLVDGYRTRLTGLTAEEAESLFFTGMPGPAAELGLGTVLAAAELKLMAALPSGIAERAGRIRERFHLDVPGWFHGGNATPYLRAVAQAVWNQQ